jgi:hypothetical protein
MHHAMKTYYSGGIAPRILELDTRWIWVVRFKFQPRFTTGGRAPGTHWIGSWVDLTAGMDAVAKRIKSLILPGIEHHPSSP